MSLYKRGATWWIVLHHEGQRVRRSTGTTDKRAAQRAHDELRAELWATPRSDAGRTWQDACVGWLTAAERSASDRYTLRALDYADRPLTECTAESFADALSGKTPGTYNRTRALIVAIFNHASMPIKLPTRKVKTGRLRFLTHAEWRRLHAALPDHLKPIAAFAIATGLRQANITHLRWDQVDLTRGVMWIHADQSKSGQPIGIPLSTEAIALLHQQLGRNAEWVFPYSGKGRAAGKPITKIKTAWQAAMERAGLGHFERWVDAKGINRKKWHGDFTFHGLRHTWASWHIMAGTPLDVLQKLGGWHDLRMVLKYAHLAPEYLASYAGNAKPWQSAQDAA